MNKSLFNYTNTTTRRFFSYCLYSGFLLFFLFYSINIFYRNKKLSPRKLIKDLACASCHSGIDSDNSILEKTPDLGKTGLKYKPAYLFDYLQHPSKVRSHIGASRMPDFGFSIEESLALTLFLSNQVETGINVPEYQQKLLSVIKPTMNKPQEKTGQGKILIKKLCLSCHKLNGKGGTSGINLENTAYRLQQDWFMKKLYTPSTYAKDSPMAGLFFKFHKEKKKLIETVPNGAEQINIITQYLFSLKKTKKNRLQKSFENALATYPDMNANIGEKIFISQNCTSCHKHSSIIPWKNGPDLSFEGDRVRQDWIRIFLKNPTPIRPFGFYPGSGSRMPNYRLSDEEISVITGFLMEQSRKIENPKELHGTKKLSVFSMMKARTLLEQKYACLGCHQLGDKGGKIGPDLSSLNTRLQYKFVRNIIHNPKGIMQNIVMPRIIMEEKTLELITNFLMQQEIPKNNSSNFSLTENELIFPNTKKTEGKELYRNYCSMCHGINGDGDGYNTEYLPQMPTDHTDKIYISKRPDDTLFDAISAGGYILDKSPFMPAWGHTLDFKKIRKLVAYIRSLCQCKGPMWSRDNKINKL